MTDPPSHARQPLQTWTRATTTTPRDTHRDSGLGRVLISLIPQPCQADAFNDDDDDRPTISVGCAIGAHVVTVIMLCNTPDTNQPTDDTRVLETPSD